MRLILIGLFIIATSVAWTSQAREVQKWIDENGVVHYGDYTEKYKAKKLNVTTSDQSHTAVESSQATRSENTDKLLKSIQEKRTQKKETTDKKTKDLALMTKNCNRAKSYLATMTNGARLVDFDENGERHFLDDKERATRTNEADKLVAQWCK